MINISDELNAATEQGVLGRASQIKDGTKMQSQINAEVQAALAQTGRIDDIRQIVRDAVGPGATADFESDEGLQVGNFSLGYYNDGDWYIDTDFTTDLDDLEVGSVVKVTALPSGEEFHVPASVDKSSLYIDSESHQIYGITGDPIPVQVGHTYRVTGIYETIGNDITIYTYEEVADSVTDLVESTAAKILDAIGDIDIDTTALAKQSNVGTSSDQASESGSSLFAVLKAVWNKVVNIYNALTDGTNGLSAIKSAIPSVSGLATETSVKDGNDTTIGLLKDQTNGLAAIKNSAASAASDAAAAKTAILANTYLNSDVNAGKMALAAEISLKGVPTEAASSLSVMAQNVRSISQLPIIMNDGDLAHMYSKQLYGVPSNDITPGYWNLYEVLVQLLNDGRLLNYGGILLAEYYRGYPDIALSGVGTGGAYVVSDIENDVFKMYTIDTTHVWNTEFDGKGNRWVAYCFANEYHDFQITDTNTSPRSIFIGRKVGTISALVNTRISKIVVPDGNKLYRFNGGTYSHNFGQSIILYSERTPIFNLNNQEKLYSEVDVWDSGTGGYVQAGNMFIFRIKEDVDGAIRMQSSGTIVCFDCDVFNASKFHIGSGGCILNEVYLITEETTWSSMGQLACDTLYIGYKTNDKTRTVKATTAYNTTGINNIKLQSGWCKPLIINNTIPTEASIYTNILQRLKQDEEDCGDGVTITLGQTNLDKLTSQESIALLDDLTNIYGYTFA